MPKYVDPTTVIDPSLDAIAACTVLHLCSALPANYAGIAALSLGSTTMAGGDFTKAAGDISGRKLTFGAKTGIVVGTSGTVTHLVLARVADSSMRYATTCASAPVQAGGTADTPAWKHEIQAAS